MPQVERIYVTYEPVISGPFIGDNRHIAIHYLTADGQHRVLDAGPKNDSLNGFEMAFGLLGERFSGSSTDSAYGAVKTNERNIAGDMDQVVRLSRFPQEFVAEGVDLSSLWDRLLEYKRYVDLMGFEYQPETQNSNNFAYEALWSAGVDEETLNRIGNRSDLETPGFFEPMEDPLDPTGEGRYDADFRPDTRADSRAVDIAPGYYQAPQAAAPEDSLTPVSFTRSGIAKAKCGLPVRR